MFNCFGYNYEPTNDLFVFLSIVFIAIVFYSLRYWPEPNKTDESKIDEFESVDFDTDILGQPVKVYEDKTQAYKPMGGIGLKTGLFVVLALLASMLVFKSFERVESFHYAGNYGNRWGTPTFVETGKKRIYNYELSEYEKDLFKNTFGLESPPVASFKYDTVNIAFKHLHEQYFNTDN